MDADAVEAVVPTVYLLQTLDTRVSTNAEQLDPRSSFSFTSLKRRLAPGVRYVTHLPPYE
jgi:hypothetical protein